MIDFSEIRDIMEEARQKHFESKGLKTSPNIYYMNGNDGTRFDYSVNDRVCEFYIFKPNERGEADAGLIKLLAEAGDSYVLYIYDYDRPFSGENVQEFSGNLRLSVYDLACHLQAEKDDKDIWDSPIESWTLKNSTYIATADWVDAYDDDDEDADWVDDEDAEE